MRGRIRIVGAMAAVAAVASAGVAGAVSQDFSVAPDGTGGASPKCAKGKFATGGGFTSSVNSAWDQNALGPRGRIFKVGLADDSGDPQTGRAFALCKNKEPFKVARKRVEFEITAASRAVVKTVEARCPRGTKLAGGGYTTTSPDSDSAYVLESKPAGRSWRLKTTQTVVGSYVLRARALCDERPRADYEVVKDALSEQAGRTRARRGLGGILNLTLEPECAGNDRPTAGGYASTGDFKPRWSTIAPQQGGYLLKAKQGFGPGGLPEGDIIGYALCRT